MTENVTNVFETLGISFAIAVMIVLAIFLVSYAVGSFLIKRDESREEDFF